MLWRGGQFDIFLAEIGIRFSFTQHIRYTQPLFLEHSILKQAMTKRHGRQPRVLRLRVLVAFGLVAAAVFFGMGSFYSLRVQENRLFENQYKSIATQAMKAAIADMNRKIGTGKVVAGILSETFPNEIDWPNVFLPGYSRIASLLRDLENDRGLGYLPIVTSENIDAFETYAKEQFEKAGLPPTAGNNSFGFGVWASDPSLSSFDKRYHDNTGETVYNSSHKIITPVIQMSYATNYLPFLLHNNHTEINKGLTIDRALDCTVQLPDRVANNSCGSMTPPLTFQTLNTEPTSLYFHPITPANNNTGPMVGATVITARWSDLLSAVSVYNRLRTRCYAC